MSFIHSFILPHPSQITILSKPEQIHVVDEELEAVGKARYLPSLQVDSRFGPSHLRRSQGKVV